MDGQENVIKTETAGAVDAVTALSEKQDVKEMNVTTASEWRKNYLNLRKIQLPSGAVFVVRNLTFTSLIARGIVQLPIFMSLSKIWEKTKSQTTDSAEASKLMESLGDDEMKAIDKIISAVTIEAVVDPRVTDRDEENSVPVNMIDFIDKLFIFSECVKGGQQNFEGFFHPPGTGIDAGLDVQPVREEAVGDSEDKQ